LTDTQIAYVRLGVTAVTFINSAITATGHNPLPFSDTDIYTYVSYAVLGVSALWAWYKDSPVTKYGKSKNTAGTKAVGTKKVFNQQLANATAEVMNAVIDKVPETLPTLDTPVDQKEK
jgi:SPP1 family holin